jgi:hypothetical protein
MSVGEGLSVFHCDRRNVTLTRGGCARLWESAAAKRPDPWEGRAACVACPVGAAHAGHALAPAAQAIEDIRLICVGCRKPSDRLIKRCYCPSCYNRRLEARRGRNAKGGTPRISAFLHSEWIAVTEGSRRRCIAVDEVLSMAEAALIMAKGCQGGTLRLGWAPLFVPQAEIEPLAAAA